MALTMAHDSLAQSTFFGLRPSSKIKKKRAQTFERRFCFRLQVKKHLTL
jgi:hypothetical protein